jgi:hypothetical protein
VATMEQETHATVADDALSNADIDDTLAAIARVAKAARVGPNYCALISYGTLVEAHETISLLRERYGSSLDDALRKSTMYNEAMDDKERLREALRDTLDAAERASAGYPLPAEEWFARRDYARHVLAVGDGKRESIAGTQPQSILSD